MMPQGTAELVPTMEGRLRRFEDDGNAAAIVSDAADQEARELLYCTFGIRAEPGVQFFFGTARALLARLYWPRFLSRDSVSTDESPRVPSATAGCAAGQTTRVHVEPNRQRWMEPGAFHLGRLARSARATPVIGLWVYAAGQACDQRDSHEPWYRLHSEVGRALP